MHLRFPLLNVQIFTQLSFSCTGLPGPAALAGAISTATAVNTPPLASAVSLAGSFIKQQQWPAWPPQPLNVFGRSAPAISPPASRIRNSTGAATVVGGGGGDGLPVPSPAVRPVLIVPVVPATSLPSPSPGSARPHAGNAVYGAARPVRALPSLAPQLAPPPAIPMPIPAQSPTPSPSPVPAPSPALPKDDDDDVWVVVENPSEAVGRKSPAAAAAAEMTFSPQGAPTEVRIRQQPAVAPLYERPGDWPPRRSVDYGGGVGGLGGRPMPDETDFEMLDLSQILLGMKYAVPPKPVVSGLPPVTPEVGSSRVAEERAREDGAGEEQLRNPPKHPGKCAKKKPDSFSFTLRFL